MKVKKCFGRYGDEDLEYSIYEGGEKKRFLKCTILCAHFPLCRDCYFLWWNINRPRKEFVRKFILKFMKENKLEFRNKNEKFTRNFKKNKI